MSDSGPKTRPSVHIDAEITAILDRVRSQAVTEMRRRIAERHNAGRNELAESEIEMLARIAGTVARSVAEQAVRETYELAVKRSSKDA